MTDHEIDWSLLDRYLSGRCSPDEITTLQQWAALDPSNARTLASVQRIWDESGIIAERFDAETAIRTLRSTRVTAELPIGVNAPSMPHSRELPTQSWIARVNRGYVALAAAAVLAVSGSFLWTWRTHSAAELATSNAGKLRIYTTVRGQRADFLLADGSHVWLNVDSHLIIPADFGDSIRQVGLEGEAYFEVRHDSRRPFLVRTSSAVVKDLGTKFLVRAYPGEPKATITVGEGRVALGSATRPSDDVALGQGQHGELDSAGAVAVFSGVDIENELVWRTGRLELRHIPLARAALEIGRWYDVDISFADTSLASVPVTASFAGESVDDAMRVLSTTLGVHYAREGTQVRLTGDPP